MPASYSARACFKATNCEHCRRQVTTCPFVAMYLRDQDHRQDIIQCLNYQPRIPYQEQQEANASAQLALLDTTEPIQTTLF